VRERKERERERKSREGEREGEGETKRNLAAELICFDFHRHLRGLSRSM